MRTIEQGHIRVGTQPVTDPAMLITRRQEDFVTWVDTSARKRTIMKYNDQVSLILFPDTRLTLTISWTISIYCNTLRATAHEYPASQSIPHPSRLSYACFLSDFVHQSLRGRCASVLTNSHDRGRRTPQRCLTIGRPHLAFFTFFRAGL